uniref:Nuclear RNA export factor 2 n=2 Tax=Cacopsylla melanoneura TaxID=428564 RepID=A0A8D8YPU2_9HEMI
MSDNRHQQRRQFIHQPRRQMNQNYDDACASNNPSGDTSFGYRSAQINRRPYSAPNSNPSQHWSNVPSKHSNKRWGSHNNKPYSRSGHSESPRNINFEMNSTLNNDSNQYQQNVLYRRDTRWSSGENDSPYSRSNYVETTRNCSSTTDATVHSDSSQPKTYSPSRKDNMWGTCGVNEKPHLSNFGSFHDDSSRNSEKEPYAQNKLKQRVNFSRNHFENKPYSRNRYHTDHSDSRPGQYEPYLEFDKRVESSNSHTLVEPYSRNTSDMPGIKAKRESIEMDSVADTGVKDVDDMVSISSDNKYEEKYNCSRDSAYEGNDEFSRDKKVNEREDCLSPLEGSELHQFKRSLSDWYHVSIFEASKLPYKKALDLISEYVRPLEFLHYHFKHNENYDNYSFLICDSDVAEKLFNTKGQIEMDNNKLKFLVNSTSPQFIPNGKMLQTIRSALAKRYDPKNNYLDLSKFYDDQDLFEADCFVPLDRSHALKYVFDIIGSTLPNLKSINLNNNKLYLRDHLTIITRAVPKLKTIFLQNNKFKTVADLKSLETLNLTELILTGNPLCRNASERAGIIELFPMFTNSIESEEPFEFSSCETTLPVERVFVCSQNAKSFVRVFLEDYFSVYDSSRLDLEHSYCAHAQFSLVAIDGVGKNAAVKDLIKTSRNLLRDSKDTKKEALLFRGKPNVLTILNQLPRTKHDTGSFTCDCPIFNEHMIHVSVTGLYEQLPVPTHDKKIIVYFERAFVLIRDSEGKFMISNDQLFITNRTQEQYIQAFSSINGLDTRFCADELEENLIKKLSLQSGITLSVCQNYLVEAEFNYDKALDALKRALNENLIPSEAFIVKVKQSHSRSNYDSKFERE